MVIQQKILNGKAFGSIPHMIGSRRGPGDHGINEGMESLLVNDDRLNTSRIIVTEKLDGSCVCVGRFDGRLHYLTRSGWPTSTSKYILHHEFERWARKQNFDFLKEGERIIGEWLGTAHGTIYRELDNPFYIFDMFHSDQRLPYEYTINTVIHSDLLYVPIVHEGKQIKVSTALNTLGNDGFLNADLSEGLVYRYERETTRSGAVRDYPIIILAKYVRPEKEPGKYLDKDQRKLIYNWRER